MTRPDPRFFATAAPMGAGEACAAAGATPAHEGAIPVTHAGTLADPQGGGVVFAEEAGALRGAGGTVALVLTTAALAEAARAAFPEASVGVAARPKAAFARVAARLHHSLSEAEDPPGGIAPDARIAPTARVAPSAVVGPRALIHDDAVIGPFAHVGGGVVIGPGSRLGAHVSVTHAVLGAGCVVAAGARIGEAGFGYAATEEGALAVPQLGRALIGEGVDVGANTTIDRGSLADTVIGDGTKIDNLCQVAHNCTIGRGVLIASQTGVSGSCVIGDGVMIGGQVGMADHLTVGEGALLTAGSGHMRDVPAGERWGGTPAKPARQWMREVAALSRLARGSGK